MPQAVQRRPAVLARLRPRTIVAGYRLAVWLAGRVPPRVGYPILDASGDFLCLTNVCACRAVVANLARTMAGRPARIRQRAGRHVFRHVLRNYYDTFRLPAMSEAEIAGFVRLEGTEHVAAALARGRGAIVVTAHVSSLVVGAQALAQRFGGATVVVEPLDPPELLDLLVAVRGSHALRMVPIGPSLAADLTAALRRSELVFLAVDRDLGAATLSVPFFGRPTPIPSGAAVLALRTGATVLSAFTARRRDGRLRGIVDPPINVTPTGVIRADMLALTSAMAARLEYHIGRYPEQWTVLQRIWPDSGRETR